MISKLVVVNQITDNDGPGDSPFIANGNFTKSFSSTLTDGAGSGKAQVVFADDRVLGAGATEDLDLSGSLKDQFGQTIAFTKIKSIYVSTLSTNAEVMSIGPASANGFLGPWADASDVTEVPAGGAFFIAYPGTGWAVTAGTADLITVTAGAAGGTYTIIIVGEGTVS